MKIFKYLVEEFGFEYLELLKQKGDYPYEYMKGFRRFNKKNCLLKKFFTALQMMEKLVIMVKYQMDT